MARITRYWPRRKDYPFDNGIEWIAHQDADIPGFYCFFASRMGTEKERRSERQGIHIHEHGFFRGRSIDETCSYNRYLGDRGIKSNGKNCTNYCYAYFHGSTLRRIDVIDAAYRSLTTMMDLQQFLIERSVVRQELEMTRSESVWTQLMDKMLRSLYGDSAYGATYGEVLKNVPRLSMTHLANLRRLFRPQNLVVVTIGRVPDEQILPHVQRTFGQLPKQPRLQAPPFTLPPRVSFQREYRHPAISIPFVQRTMRCGNSDPQSMARLQLLADILATDETSPLYEDFRVVLDGSYVPSVSAEMGRPEDLLHIRYPALAENVERSLAIIDHELDRLAQGKLLSRDFQRLQRRCVWEFCQLSVNPVQLGEWYIQNAANRRFLRPKKFQELVKALQPKDIAEAVRQWREGSSTRNP